MTISLVVSYVKLSIDLVVKRIFIQMARGAVGLHSLEFAFVIDLGL